MSSNPARSCQKPIQQDCGSHERDRQSQPIGSEQERPFHDGLFEACKKENRSQNGPDAGRPTRSEGDAHRQCPKEPRGLPGEVEPPLTGHAREAQPPQHEEGEQDHHDPTRPGDGGKPLGQGLAEEGGGGSQGHEDEAEADPEHERVDRRLASSPGNVPPLQLVQRHPGDEGDVSGDHREHAGREKGDDPGDEGQGVGDGDLHGSTVDPAGLGTGRVPVGSSRATSAGRWGSLLGT